MVLFMKERGRRKAPEAGRSLIRLDFSQACIQGRQGPSHKPPRSLSFHAGPEDGSRTARAPGLGGEGGPTFPGNPSPWPAVGVRGSCPWHWQGCQACFRVG